MIRILVMCLSMNFGCCTRSGKVYHKLAEQIYVELDAIRVYGRFLAGQ
ncbi:hypothetical protein [Geobacter sp. AOG1]|nr:hypothetical protein [Geobacter sp. AOG1]